MNLDQHLLKQNHTLRPFRSVCEWARRNLPDTHTMLIRANTLSASEHAKRYNPAEASEVAAPIVGAEDGKIGTSGNVIQKRGAVNPDGNQNFKHDFYRSPLLRSVNRYAFFPDCRSVWYHGLVMGYNTNGIPNLQDREGHVIEAGCFALPVALVQEVQASQRKEA